MQRKHGGCIFSDNLDGTLSVVGHRDDDARFQAVRGWGRKDALVVKQGAKDPAAQQQPNPDTTELSQQQSAAPNLPTQPTATPAPKPNPPVPSSVVHTPASQSRNHYLTPAANARPVKNLEGTALETWNYIRPFLTEFTECPDSSWVPELLKLPKVRDIVWDDAYIEGNGFKDRLSRDVATLVLQVTGEVPPKACSRCRGKKGPYGECIVISPQAPIDARLLFAACASCIYNGQGTYCTAKFWGKKRAEADALKALPSAGQQVEADIDETNISLPNGSQSQSAVRRSERVQVKEATVQSVPDARDVPATGNAPLVTGKVNRRRPSSSPLAPPPPSPTPPPQLPRTANRRSEFQADLQPTITATMEIEEWELAPGRLQSAAHPQDGGLPETIAFSQPYLTANQSVPAAQDTTFRVDVISSGSSLRFTATPDRVRICSVGAGKVKVRMQGEEEFDIGPHGMFRVLTGRSCVVFNRLYGEAVLHVTEVADYS